MKTKIIEKKEFKKKVAVVVGTRPSIMKMGPIIHELRKRKIDHFFIHAGQHYSPNLALELMKDLNLPKPKYWLTNIKNFKLHGAQTAGMLKGIEQILIKEKPRVVLVCADANFNLAGALAARKLGMVLGHVESGLRSNDWRMPEEHNRIMIDHISDYLLAPTKESVKNLKEDNVKGKIVLSGNTIVDAVIENVKIADKKSKILDRYKLEPRKYFVLTCHREENVDHKNSLHDIVRGVKKVCQEHSETVVYAIHPRTKKMLKHFGLWKEIKAIKGLKIIEPPAYLDFLKLMKYSRLIITDAGGLQEEGCILKIPCVTLRENTERPETIKIGSNTIAGTDPTRISKAVNKMLKVAPNWKNPFGDGRASKKIVDAIINELK
jgi:UDP-N-acetylglucosamine 2-epimerase (non-hydrolysing)